MLSCPEIIQRSRRPVDRALALDALFAPKSVALIGATEAVGRVGRAVLENLHAFDGPVYPVNPKRERVLGMKSYPSVSCGIHSAHRAQGRHARHAATDLPGR